jgi:hypothetical protein
VNGLHNNAAGGSSCTALESRCIDRHATSSPWGWAEQQRYRVLIETIEKDSLTI